MIATSAIISTGRNRVRDSSVTATWMDSDLALLVDSLRGAKVEYINAATEEHAARVAADLVQRQVQLLGMILRRQAA